METSQWAENKSQNTSLIFSNVGLEMKIHFSRLRKKALVTFTTYRTNEKKNLLGQTMAVF